MKNEFKFQVTKCPNFCHTWEVEDYKTHQVDKAGENVCTIYGYEPCGSIKTCPIKNAICAMQNNMFEQFGIELYGE